MYSSVLLRRRYYCYCFAKLFCFISAGEPNEREHANIAHIISRSHRFPTASLQSQRRSHFILRKQPSQRMYAAERYECAECWLDWILFWLSWAVSAQRHVRCALNAQHQKWMRCESVYTAAADDDHDDDDDKDALATAEWIEKNKIHKCISGPAKSQKTWNDHRCWNRI